MYGPVFSRSRSCGVLMNAAPAVARMSHPAGGGVPVQPGSGGGGGAPLSLLVTAGASAGRYGLLNVTCGTAVSWVRLSVKSGPPWHSMQPPLPWKSFSPRRAASESLPSSKAVAGGGRVLTEATSWAERFAAASLHAAVLLFAQSPWTNRFMWPLTGRRIAAFNVPTLPSQKYGDVFSSPHRAGASRGPSKSVMPASPAPVAWVSWVIVPRSGLAAPSAWQVWDDSPSMKRHGARETLRPSAH